MLNTRSNYLVILVATYNRLDLLKRTVNSINRGTKCSHEVIVIDGGSTDGTIEYLKRHSNIIPVLQGRLLGTARCYNEVWRQIDSKYTCWLSDDTEITSGSVDLAVQILENNPCIGMVGLKMKDVTGPWLNWPYKTSISQYGIVNCNHGVLPLKLLRELGYFNESYYSYTIDPDLTASVLCAGRQVAMTKNVSVLHHREWSEGLSREDAKGKVVHAMRGIDNRKVYEGKFGFLGSSLSRSVIAKKILMGYLESVLFFRARLDSHRFGLLRQDWSIVANSRFISVVDPIITANRPYHLIQEIPLLTLAQHRNPYRHLLGPIVL